MNWILPSIILPYDQECAIELCKLIQQPSKMYCDHFPGSDDSVNGRPIPYTNFNDRESTKLYLRNPEAEVNKCEYSPQARALVDDCVNFMAGIPLEMNSSELLSGVFEVDASSSKNVHELF